MSVLQKIPSATDTGAATESTLQDVRDALQSSYVQPDWDDMQATYPTDTTEVYTYSKNSVQVAVVTVTYTDNTKATITSVVRS